MCIRDSRHAVTNKGERMRMTMTLALALAPAIAFAQSTSTTPKTDDKAAMESHSKMETPATTNKDDNTTRTVDSKNPDQLMTDARIASILHKVNKAEIDAGKLAEKHGQSADVKDFGRMLVKDHTDADAKLTSLCKTSKIDLDTLNGPDKDMLKVNDEKMDQVKKMKGGDFD